MYGLDPAEESAIEEKARSRPFDPTLDAAPGAFAGAGTATAKGLWGAFESANTLFNDALAPIVEPFLRPIDAAFGTESATWFDREITQASHEALRRTRPDPAVTGAVGQVLLYGVTAMLPQAAAGFMAGGPAGAASLVGAAQGNAARLNAIDEGVDPATAVGVGAIEGVADAAGVVLPGGIGSTVIKKVASGIGMNVVAGGAQRGATGAFLRANGYEAQADQYRVLDGMALATDAILGGAFGAMHGMGEGAARPEAMRREPTPSEVDAALAAHDIHNLELDSAPGIPVDLATRNAHADAMELAMAQVLRGDPVNVAQALKAGEFIERPPDVDSSKDIQSAMNEAGYDALAINPFTDGENKRFKMPVEKRRIFAPVPREPLRLSAWVKKVGGIRDDDNEVLTIVGKMDRKLIKVKAGHGLDNIALMATESGYFPHSGGERATINEFLDKLREDINGTPQYSDRDVDAVLNRMEAMRYNEGIGQLVDRYDIKDIHNMTGVEFWDKVAERISEEHHAEEVASRAAHHARLLEEAIKSRNKFIDSRGDSWEPDATDRGKSATIEDLEHERRQEEIARGAQRSKDNDGGQAVSFRGEGEVRGSLQSRGGYVELDGRLDAERITEKTVKELVERDVEAIIEKAPAIEIAQTGEGDAVRTQTAKDAVAEADDAVTQAKADAKLFDVAINCFIGHGQ